MFTRPVALLRLQIGVSLLSFRYHQVRSPSVFSSSRINILCGVNTHSDRMAGKYGGGKSRSTLMQRRLICFLGRLNDYRRKQNVTRRAFYTHGWLRVTTAVHTFRIEHRGVPDSGSTNDEGRKHSYLRVTGPTGLLIHDAHFKTASWEILWLRCLNLGSQLRPKMEFYNLAM